MVMPNIGAFIAWGTLTALFIEKGWFPNEQLSSIVNPMLTYVLPILIAYQGGKNGWRRQRRPDGSNCHNRCYLWNRVHNVYGSHDYGTLSQDLLSRSSTKQ